MNIKLNVCGAEKFHNVTKPVLIAILLMTTLGCGKWAYSSAQPEIMRSIEYREDEQDGLYDIEYENSIPYDRDDECIMLSREEQHYPRNMKKIAPDTLSIKRK